jgi:hypothetical protein
VTSQPFGSRGGTSGHVASARKSVLHGVLGRREVRSAPNEDTDHRGDQLPQQGLFHSVIVGGAVRNGRTSSHS